jgi:hypothetical protein
VFTSDGLNLYFYALTAHFGQWVAGAGRRTRQWHLAAGLIYGQVKKAYQRRKLVGVTYVMRCGTRLALKTRLQALGLSGKLNTAFVERIKKDATAERGSAGAANLVNCSASAASAPASGLVAERLPFRAPT